MGKAVKIKFKNQAGSVPKGYEIQVICAGSQPTEKEIHTALINAGFKEFGNLTKPSLSSTYIEIIK